MAYKPFDLTGKVVLITGGNRGIGLGMAEALVDAGAGVAIWGTNAGRNAAAVEALKARGGAGAVSSQVVDVADETAVTAAMAAAVDTHGRLDGVVANAGVIAPAKSFLDLDAATWRKVMSVNLDGAFYTLREAARHMRARAEAGDPGGSLAVTSSLAAISGAARNQHYGATKGAVISMIKAIAVEFARFGVRANAILPGWIATDMTDRHRDNPAFVENVLPRVPARRWGEPEDFGGIAVYLMSEASRYHNGDTLLIDGGYAVF